MSQIKHRPAFANVGIADESGMTLVETLVVSAIMMVLALAMTTLITNLSKQNDAQATKANITQLQNAVRTESQNVSSVRASMGVID